MEDFETSLIQVYIKLDNKNVIAVNSSVFIDDLTDWVLIDEGNGDKYVHAQGNYFDKPLVTDEGIYRYKYLNGRVKEKSQEEIDWEISLLPKPEPTTEQDLMAMAVDHEFRLTLLELGA